MKTEELDNLADIVAVEFAHPGIDSYRHTISKKDISTIKDYFDKKADLFVEVQSSEAESLTDLSRKYCVIFSRRRK
jgi:hypothetical protein